MFGDKEQLQALQKLQPLQLPTSTLPSGHELFTVRSSFYYVYVINWLYNYKGYLRLASEYFDVELFEMELLDLLTPPPLDPSVLFINKLKTQIVHQLVPGNKFSYVDFDVVIKKTFVNTPLKEDTSFDHLPLLERFELLFVILNYFTSLAGFRAFLDRNPDVITNQTILKSTVKNNTKEETILFFNNTKVYKRTVTVPELNVPKKRKDSPLDPDEFYDGKFDIDLSSVKFDIELWTLEDFEQHVAKKGKSLLKPITNKEFQSNIVQSEIKKRRILQNRKKEYQMLNLMATRKKSSRLEAKERQKQAEEEEEKERRDRELKLALELQQITKPLNYDSNVLSREERLKMRKLNSGYKKESKEPSSQPETIKSSMEPEEVTRDSTPAQEDTSPQTKETHFENTDTIDPVAEKEAKEVKASEDAMAQDAEIITEIEEQKLKHEIKEHQKDLTPVPSDFV